LGTDAKLTVTDGDGDKCLVPCRALLLILIVSCLVFDVPAFCTTRTDTQLNCGSKTLNLHIVNATSLAKADAVQPLGLDLVKSNDHVALVTETWFCNKYGAKIHIIVLLMRYSVK
jgi:hypothetical protein